MSDASAAEPIYVFALKYGLLQVLSAVDAVDHDGVPAERAILVVMESRASTGVLRDVEWGEVHTVSDRVRGPHVFRRLVRQRRYRKAVSGAIRRRPVSDLYIGHYSIELSSVARAVHPMRVTVLDDGTSTVYRSEERAADLSRGRRSPLPWHRTIVKRLAGVDPRHLSSVRFFTIFRPALTEGDRYDPCDLEVFSRRASSKSSDPDLLWILGTNVVDMGHLDADTYERMVGAVIATDASSLRAPRVQYHPHPRESADRLAGLADRLGVDVVGGADPVEIRLLDAPTLPGRGLVSFPSSALVSLSKLLPADVRCSMITLSGLATWSPLDTVERTVVEHLGDRFTVIDGPSFLQGP